MKYSQSLSAKKYAKAYVQEYGDRLTLQDIEHMKSVIRFCRKYHNFMSLVSLLTSKQVQRHELIDNMFEHFFLPDTLKKLIDLLVARKKLFLFSSVLQDICCLYLKLHNLLEVTIYTATELTPEEQQKFEQFFMKLSNQKIMSHVVKDETLIAGVRMQSDILLWEHSIAARIRLLSMQVDFRNGPVLNPIDLDSQEATSNISTKKT